MKWYLSFITVKFIRYPIKLDAKHKNAADKYLFQLILTKLSVTLAALCIYGSKTARNRGIKNTINCLAPPIPAKKASINPKNKTATLIPIL